MADIQLEDFNQIKFMKKNFKIENNILNIDVDDLYSNKLNINSSPFPYELTFYTSIEQIQNKLTQIFKNKSERFLYWDKNVKSIYGEVFNHTEDDIYSSSIDATEDNKNIYSSLKLIENFQVLKFTKRETFVSIGGGITQDISAVTRALYKRGIDWIYIPTTLLSMADSCIGAKTALNHGGIKNQVALFSAPKNVFVCDKFLNTLSEDDVYSGFGEILKLVIIGGEFFINEFNSIESSKLSKDEKILKFIKLSLNIKKAVIEFDEFEVDVRRSLNYGHTIGHAIEPILNYKIPHGVAVSIGMIIENLISVDFNFLDSKISDRYNSMINKYIPKKYWKILSGIEYEKMILNLLQDKKTMSNQIKFAVPSSLNEFDIMTIDKANLAENYLKKLIENAIKTFC